MQPGNWPDGHRPLVDARGNVVGIVAAKLDASAALAASGSLPESLRTATSELRGEEQFALELPRISAGRGGKAQRAVDGGAEV